MRLIVATVGFDEKLVVRSLLSLGLRGDDVILIVYAEPRDEHVKVRVENAVKTLREVVRLGAAAVEELPLTVMNLGEDLSRCAERLRELVEERRVDEVTAVLVGGMRPLIIIVLSALLILARLRGIRVRFMFSREDGLYSFTLNPSYFCPPGVGQREAQLLRVIAGMEGRPRREV